MELNDAREIELSDKQLFDKYFLEFKPEISELTFTNLFIWRHHYNFLFKEWKNQSDSRCESAIINPGNLYPLAGVVWLQWWLTVGHEHES